MDSMNDFFDYLLSIGRSKNTTKTYGKNLKKYYKYLSLKKNREIFIDELTSDEVEEYLLDNTVNLSIQSKHVFLTSFKSFMGYCFNKGLCPVSIGKELKQVKCRVKEKTSLTEEEFQTLVDNIGNPVLKCVVYTMYYTGCRINELVELTMNDVDFGRNIITIRKPKGHRHKSRIIPINHKLKHLLLEYLSIRLGGKTEDSFFVLKRSGRISGSTVNQAIKEATQKAELDRNITNHIIRHTFASLLAEKGIDLKRIQTLLGHSNLDITNIYLHANPRKLREAVNLL